MNYRTEVDIALLGYAIQIEREAQYKNPDEVDKQMSQFKCHQKISSEVRQGNIGSTSFKTKK